MAESPVAVVTGGSSGIGRATAEHLVEQGYRVVICARGADRLEEDRARLGTDRVAWHACDVGDEAAAAAAIGVAIDRFGRLDGSSAPPGDRVVQADRRAHAGRLGRGARRQPDGPIFRQKAATRACTGERGGAVVIVSSINASGRAGDGAVRRREGRARQLGHVRRAGAGPRRDPRQLRGAGLGADADGRAVLPRGRAARRAGRVQHAATRRAPGGARVGDRVPARRRRFLHDRQTVVADGGMVSQMATIGPAEDGDPSP